MLALKSGLRFFVSAPEVLFFVTWKRALLAKVPVFRCQKMALRVPRQKNRDHFLMPTSPQNDVQHVCFMHLSLLGGFWANLKKMAFWARFPPLNDQIGKKSTYIGRNGPRAKTKTVIKPVKQWEKLGSMPNLKFKTFLNKNPPTIHHGMGDFFLSKSDHACSIFSTKKSVYQQLFGNLEHILATFIKLWQLFTTCETFWQLVITFFWQLLAICGNL